MKVLIVVHGHPQYSHGGGEVAAYAMYESLKKAGHSAYILAWNNQANAGEEGRPIVQVANDEWMISTKTEFFTFSSINNEAVEAYKTLITSLKPDVIHFHHFIHLGIELPTMAKKVLPKVKVFMTLHEYLLICNNNGQMIKTDGALCERSSPQECNKCFPSISPEAFFMREGYLKNCLAVVDQFISPSNFLRDRFIAWGIPKERITYLENILNINKSKNLKSKYDKIKIFGYFGQINYYKGLDILLDAMELIAHLAPKIRLHINGNFSAINSPKYQKELEDRIESLGDMVEFKGPYSNTTLLNRMDQVGWLVMSSRWWENSPVVIQEALANKTPVILPNIGGMEEKMKKNGFLYEAKDPESLSKVLLKAATIKQAEYSKFNLSSEAEEKSLVAKLLVLYKNS